MEKAKLESRSEKNNPLSKQPAQPSESAADQEFFVSFGVIVSCRLGNVEPIRRSILEARWQDRVPNDQQRRPIPIPGRPSGEGDAR